MIIKVMFKKMMPVRLRVACIALRTKFLRKTIKIRTRLLPRKNVKIDRLLLGDEIGIEAARYARMVDNPLRPSTPVEEWPHTLLLRDYEKHGEKIFASDIFDKTAYAINAQMAIDILGEYFQGKTLQGVVEIARDFIGRHKGETHHCPDLASGNVNGHSATFMPILVRPIAYSDCYQVSDGHHRIASAWVNGQRTIRVAVAGKPVLTPLQEMLADETWNNGTKELYQPLPFRELEKEWQLVRRCEDRLRMMQSCLTDNGICGSNGYSYLDVACFYGWFVKEMHRAGFESYGVERDPTACKIAKLVYTIPAERIFRIEAVKFLKVCNRRYDIVSCLSLIHHFALGRSYIGPEEFVRLLDAVTSRILFIDMGQCTEKWFAESLAGWSPDFIEQWLRKNTSFDTILRLGIDADNVPPYEKQYGRTLFACIRK